MSDVVDGLTSDLGIEDPAGQPPPPEPPAPEPPAAAPEPPPPPQEQPSGRPDPGFVPLAAVLDEREKRKDLERQLAEFRRSQPPAQAAPTIYDDPEGYQAAVEQKLSATEANMRFDMSERFAKREHGAEAVEAAKQWALQQDPYTRQRFLADPDPIGSIVAAHRQQTVIQQVGSDPDEYVRRRAAELGFVQAGSPPGVPPRAQPQPAPVTPPPRSLASTPAADGGKINEGAVGLDAGFSEVFGKKG